MDGRQGMKCQFWRSDKVQPNSGLADAKTRFLTPVRDSGQANARGAEMLMPPNKQTQELKTISRIN